MLKQLPLKKIKVQPSTYIEIDGGVTIFVDSNKNVHIDGHNKLIMRSAEEIDLNAKNINLNAQENVYIGSGNGIVQQAPRIDLNPNGSEDGYKGNE